MAVYYPSEDLSLNIARGLVKGTTFEHKFGAVPEMPNGSSGTIWDVNGTNYPWSAFDTANNIVLTANSNDNNKIVTVVGLDENYLPIQEEITIVGGNGASENKFKRVHRAFISSGVSNVNTVSMSVNSTVVARITAGFGQTLMAVYTIPAGKTAFLAHGAMSCQQGADATGNMFVRFFGQQAFRVGHTFEVTGASHYQYKFNIPIPIPEKSDIDVRANVRTNKARITAAFDLILIDNGLGA